MARKRSPSAASVVLLKDMGLESRMTSSLSSSELPTKSGELALEWAIEGGRARFEELEWSCESLDDRFEILVDRFDV